MTLTLTLTLTLTMTLSLSLTLTLFSFGPKRAVSTVQWPVLLGGWLVACRQWGGRAAVLQEEFIIPWYG